MLTGQLAGDSGGDGRCLPSLGVRPYPRTAGCTPLATRQLAALGDYQARSGVRVDPRHPSHYRRAPVNTYRIYDRTDEHGIVGTVAPGLFAQEGRC